MRKAISYWAMRVRISGIAELAMIELVELGQVVEHPPPGRGGEARRVREIEHRVAHRAELDPLVRGRQEAAAPEPVVERLVVRVARPLRDHHHERRQVLVLASQAVGDPRADAGPAGKLGAGLEERHRRVVVDRLGVHRLDEAQLVRDLRRVRQELARRVAPLWPCRAKRNRLAATGNRSCREVMPVSRCPFRIESGRSVPCSRVELGLGVEQIHLRRCTRLKQIDDAPGPAARNSESPRRPRRPQRPMPRSSAWQLAIEQAHASAIVPNPTPARPKKCRRVMAASACSRRGSTGNHSLVIVSSRFKISWAIAV